MHGSSPCLHPDVPPVPWHHNPAILFHDVSKSFNARGANMFHFVLFCLEALPFPINILIFCSFFYGTLFAISQAIL